MHAVRVSTVLAKTCFWLLCYHYFGARALLYVVAGWAFVLLARDLTFARVRLVNLMNPAKRDAALVRSVSLEGGLLVLRMALIAGVASLVAQFQPTVAAIVAGLAICPVLWSRETLVTLIRQQGVLRLMRYLVLLSSLAGLATIALMAELDQGPVCAAIAALLVREAVLLVGDVVLVALARAFPSLRAEASDDDDDDDEEGGAVVARHEDGRPIRSGFRVFIADNVVYSRWRAMQLASRVVANGLLGPLGAFATRLFFTYRRPGDYVHRPQRMSTLRVALVGGAVLACAALLAWLAETYGLLPAAGILAAAFAARIVAISLNLLFWRSLSDRIGR